MKELEEQTYHFAVQGIGFIKSLEKDFPQLIVAGLKQSIGNVSLQFMDALEAKENEDFAKNLKNCRSNVVKSQELLKTIDGISKEALVKQHEILIRDASLIKTRLDSIISKLIY